MTREEAIEYLVGMGIESLADGLNEAVTMAIEALSTDAEWIPCSERLPSESGQYICTLPFGDNDDNEHYVWALSFHKGKFYDDDEEWGIAYYDDVVAWMPLPKPYREDGGV